ncbi:MAG: electron transfer flavoprotein subunit alpha/FixB family protein [Candidatus Bathyarchaeota archaeon]|nr:MAG: electron transfer flavoprotein subunit alpha/FixB family protein [Candidatus Bathyarchaeota archaeon]
MSVTQGTVLAYSENHEIMLQLLAKGRELADKVGVDLCALTVNPSDGRPGELVEHGADKVYVVDDPSMENFRVEPYRSVVLEAVNIAQPDIILIGATKRGKELAARVASALDTGCMTECFQLDVDDEGRLKAERLTYGGSTIAHEVSNRKPHMATVPSRAFNKLEPSQRAGEIVEIKVEISDPRVNVVETREKSKGDVNLEDASIIVSAGRGFKAEEDLKLLKELAEVLGANIGCTRPIAADLGWMEEWIGISGHKVSPKLYVACGVSGTIQHAAGIRDSQIIVSINNEETSNIHGFSDYSIVGDLYTVLPALTKALKEKLK